MLILNRQQIEDLLDLDKLINDLAPAMIDLSAGAVSMPQRVVAMVPDQGGLLGVMPAYVPSSSTLSSKLVTVYPDNPHKPIYRSLRLKQGRVSASFLPVQRAPSARS